MAVPDTSLRAIARDHWRYFIGMWLLPFVWIALPVVLGPRLDETVAWLAIGLFLGAAIYAGVPFRRGEISLWQVFFWSSVVPLLIFAILVLGIFGLALLPGVLGGGSA